MVEVADQSGDPLPLPGVRVPQPETPENGEEVVNLNITDTGQCWAELLEPFYQGLNSCRCLISTFNQILEIVFEFGSSLLNLL